MEAGRLKTGVEIGPNAEEADRALKIIDTIITDIYMPSRGQDGYKTERVTLVGVPHMPHRENIAEHSQHLAFTAMVLWDNREQLGLDFPENFDINEAVAIALVHDSPVEVFAGDIDAMAQTEDIKRQKAAEEMAAMMLMRWKYPFLKGVADRWQSYETKDSFESEYVNDLNHIVGTRVISQDGGNRWHSWEGRQTAREYMVACMRSKLRTDIGHAIFDALERDLDNRPELFPDYRQDSLF
jgi:5'-deoxynucleotidase YfbR-like HD superfamily hydrolase